MKKKETFNYFNEFINNCEYIINSAEILKFTIDEYNVDDLEKNITKVHGFENEADEKLHSINKYLIRDFLPPIDREDISRIAHKLDDIEDEIDEILINFKILNIKTLRDEAKEFCKLICEMANQVQDVLKIFENFKKHEIIRASIIEINKTEERGDRLFERAMKRLYEEENPVEMIKWTEIFKCFEDALDACESLGDLILDVVIKNS